MSINSSTGEISGIVSPSAISSTPCSVTVTEVDGATSVSQSFQWNVQQIALTSPVSLFNTDGDHVRVPITVSAPAGDSIRYSASGLPAGLRINATTGTIYGRMARNADASGPYSVAVTATDTTTSASTSETFSWTVAQAGQNGSNLTPAQKNMLGYWQAQQNIWAAAIGQARYIRIPLYQGYVANDLANLRATIADIRANGNTDARRALLAGYLADFFRDQSALNLAEDDLRTATTNWNTATAAINRILSGR